MDALLEFREADGLGSVIVNPAEHAAEPEDPGAAAAQAETPGVNFGHMECDRFLPELLHWILCSNHRLLGLLHHHGLVPLSSCLWP